ncbi:hypothetical protein [Vibrio sp.]|jgi:hypothetical protein|uniref:hypothetical protein n=1 Tax=Vibrio sp. TaxID=678 RepID=UPI003D0F1C39
MDHGDDHEFEFILETHSPADRVFLRSLLDAEGVTYYLQGEHVAPYFYHALGMRLMVRRDQADQVRELLSNFISTGSFNGLK